MTPETYAALAADSGLRLELSDEQRLVAKHIINRGVRCRRDVSLESDEDPRRNAVVLRAAGGDAWAFTHTNIPERETALPGRAEGKWTPGATAGRIDL